MCDSNGHAHDHGPGAAAEARALLPRPVTGSAADPITLEPVDEPVVTMLVEPTLKALSELDPDVVVPAHCTGWKAQLRLAGSLPDAFIPNAVGTSFHLTAA